MGRYVAAGYVDPWLLRVTFLEPAIGSTCIHMCSAGPCLIFHAPHLFQTSKTKYMHVHHCTLSLAPPTSVCQHSGCSHLGFILQRKNSNNTLASILLHIPEYHLKSQLFILRKNISNTNKSKHFILQRNISNPNHPNAATYEFRVRSRRFPRGRLISLGCVQYIRRCL